MSAVIGSLIDPRRHTYSEFPLESAVEVHRLSCHVWLWEGCHWRRSYACGLLGRTLAGTEAAGETSQGFEMRFAQIGVFQSC